MEEQMKKLMEYNDNLLQLDELNRAEIEILKEENKALRDTVAANKVIMRIQDQTIKEYAIKLGYTEERRYDYE